MSARSKARARKRAAAATVQPMAPRRRSYTSYERAVLKVLGTTEDAAEADAGYRLLNAAPGELLLRFMSGGACHPSLGLALAHVADDLEAVLHEFHHYTAHAGTTLDGSWSERVEALSGRLRMLAFIEMRALDQLRAEEGEVRR